MAGKNFRSARNRFRMSEKLNLRSMAIIDLSE